MSRDPSGPPVSDRLGPLHSRGLVHYSFDSRLPPPQVDRFSPSSTQDTYEHQVSRPRVSHFHFQTSTTTGGLVLELLVRFLELQVRLLSPSTPFRNSGPHCPSLHRKSFDRHRRHTSQKSLSPPVAPWSVSTASLNPLSATSESLPVTLPLLRPSKLSTCPLRRSEPPINLNTFLFLARTVSGLYCGSWVCPSTD